MPQSAPHSRVAFSISVSSTGWRSKVERLITFNTSLVAVCCSRASVEVAVAGLELLEQADVLDGDDGLVGEGRHELDLLGANGSGFALSRG